MRPVVVVPGYVKEVPFGPTREDALVIPYRYLEAVRRAGGEPLVLPYDADGAVDRANALLLPGGGDLDPASYGRERDPRTAGVDERRDASELRLARDAVAAGLPVLAICRGAQLLNVALGGTLVQHVEGTEHRRADERGLLHAIEALPGSRVAAACGSRFEAWSSHHQALDVLGDGLRVTAWAPDGIVEAVEGEERWTVAVQWHPERTERDDPAQQALFRAFVDAARR